MTKDRYVDIEPTPDTMENMARPLGSSIQCRREVREQICTAN